VRIFFLSIILFMACAPKKQPEPDLPPRIDFDLEDEDLDDLPEADDTGDQL
jgi:hypothetical protein